MPRRIAITDADSPFTVPDRESDSSLIEEPVIISCDVSGGAITINLPATSNFINRQVIVNDNSNNADTNNITVTNGTINGAASVVIDKDNGSTIVQAIDENNRWEATTGNIA